MAANLKSFLVVLNRYDKKTDTPRIQTDFFILKAPAIPETKHLKPLFKNAVIHAIQNTPAELSRAKTDPDYKVTWKDVHKMPASSLAAFNLEKYDAKKLPGFNGITVLNVNDHATFDISSVTDPAEN